MFSYFVFLFFLSPLLAHDSAIVFKDSQENVIPYKISNTQGNELTKTNQTFVGQNIVEDVTMSQSHNGYSFKFKEFMCTFTVAGKRVASGLPIMKCDHVLCKLGEKSDWVCDIDETLAITCNIKLKQKIASCWENLQIRNIFDAPTRRPVCPEGHNVGHDNQCRPEF